MGLVGPGGLLNQFTKNVLEIALNAELTEHLGYEHGGAPLGSHMRNGTRSKTVVTKIGPVEIEVAWDRDGSFEAVIVPKRKRRLDGIDQIVVSLTARGLTTGESAAHFDEVYGAKGVQRRDQADRGEGHRRTRRVGLPPAGCALPGHLRRHDRGLRRAQGPTRGDQHDLGVDGGATVHRPPDPQLVPLRRAASGRDREVSQAGLYAPVQGCGEEQVQTVRT